MSANSVSKLEKIGMFMTSFISPGLFRLLLALLVVVYHSVDFLTIGHYAVYVFFILSGYWIFKMYNEKYICYENAYFVYLISRLSRILPVYWLILLFSILIGLVFPEILKKLSQVQGEMVEIGISNILVLGLGISPFKFLVPAWSLDLEIQFYLVAPLLIVLCRNTNIAVCLFILSSISSLVLLYFKATIIEMNSVFVYMPLFLTGGLIYTLDLKTSSTAAVLGILTALLLLAINYLIPDLRNSFLLNKNASLLGFNYAETLNIILAILTIPLIMVNVRTIPNGRLLKLDGLFSSMSYVIYLLHWPLFKLYSISVKNVGIIQKSSHLVIYYIMCVILSWFVSKYVDVWFEKKRRLWLKQKMMVTVK